MRWAIYSCQVYYVLDLELPILPVYLGMVSGYQLLMVWLVKFDLYLHHGVQMVLIYIILAVLQHIIFLPEFSVFLLVFFI